MTEQNDFIKLLFDTLKETTDDNTTALQKLIDQQVHLVGNVEKWSIVEPKHVPEIKQEIKDHVISAFNERKKISGKIDDVLEKVNDLSGKVKLMIGIVVAAVALTGIVYVVGRYMIEYQGPMQQIAEIEEKIQKQQQDEHRELIEAVREEIKKLHPDADKQEEVR
ncbi:unnamed protein product [marine sediment metagenome]|uniref:Uncharacterized protein n=1 Tax=marine sediment metagenome TaxID=412755 RepID=X1A322_9ZZZZ